MIPSNAEAGGAERSAWLTHYPNDPRLNGPDRTLDYLFHSPKLQRLSARCCSRTPCRFPITCR